MMTISGWVRMRLKSSSVQSQAHAEQHDAQHVAGVRLPTGCGRHEVVEDGPDDDDERKPLGQPIRKGLTFSMVFLFPCLV